jgi:threonine aldolase
MDRIDFRSDTVTWPTRAMREAMANAEVGDDVYGEDPTVNELENLAAEKVAKEAGLFVASGTMGNLVGIMTHATRGDELIVGYDSHVMLWEAGSIASLGSVIPRTLQTDRYGQMDVAAVEAAIRWDDVHLPRSRVIHVENSYGSKYGYPLPPRYFTDIREVAHRHQLLVHMDGARIFNAAIACNVPPAEITQHVDSITFCLSKGLAAPVGSVLCGSKDFIARARRIRKSLGGGMRQAGILAAAGIVSLTEMVDRLEEDHKHAHLLASGLAKIPGIFLDVDMVKTNIVFFELDDDVPFSAEDIVQRLREEGNILVGTDGLRRFRAVTHCWINRRNVEVFLELLEEIIGS